MPVTTGKLMFEFTPASGGIATGLQELEIWTGAAPVNVKNGAALLDKLLNNTAPAQGRLYAALNAGANRPWASSAPLPARPDDPVDNSFSFTLDRDPAHFVRAYLTYELAGTSHWMMARRSINGNAAQGGNLWVATDGAT